MSNRLPAVRSTGITPRAADSLDRLLSPTGLEEFVSTYWEQKYLLIERSDPTYYSDLCSVEEVDVLLNGIYSHLSPVGTHVRLGVNGELLPPQDYTRNLPGATNSDATHLNLDSVYSHYWGGGTIILQRIHQYSPAIGRLCRHLQLLFGVASQANAYLTPPRSQGFSAHFDTHDVFVVQVSGTKKWRIYNTVVPSASPGTKNQADHRQHYALTDEFVLSAGDLLYIPRGLVHEAATSEDVSLHLTLGVNPYTWADVLKDALELAVQRCEPLRRSVSPQFNAMCLEKAETLKGFQAAVDCLTSGVMKEVLRGRLDADVESQRPLLPGQLGQFGMSPSLCLDTHVSLRDTVTYRFELADDAVSLVGRGKRIEFPRFVEPSLRELFSGESLRVGSLVGNLTDGGKIVLVSRLIQEGFLEIVGDDLNS